MKIFTLFYNALNIFLLQYLLVLECSLLIPVQMVFKSPLFMMAHKQITRIKSGMAFQTSPKKWECDDK